MALLPFLHGDTGTIPVSGLDLGLFILVVTAGTQRSAQIVLMLGQPLNHNRRNAGVSAKICPRSLGVTHGEVAHDLKAFLLGLIGFVITHRDLGVARQPNNSIHFKQHIRCLTES